jgi:hypothetical protein
MKALQNKPKHDLKGFKNLGQFSCLLIYDRLAFGVVQGTKEKESRDEKCHDR